MSKQRLVGVTVLPEYLQCEGVEAVLDNLVRRAGVNAVATSPYVMEEGNQNTGNREPPIDAGAGSVRLLDRPLWGKRELWVQTAPSFVPNRKLYNGLRYQPAEPSRLTHNKGRVIDEFIAAAHARGLRVYFQVMAAIPPGYRVQFGGPTEDDAPRLPDGRIPPRRVDKNGSLASPHIIAYQQALIRDLCSQYPGLDAIRFDWPEYPPYLLDSAFLDFSDHARAAAARLGFDFDALCSAAAALYKRLHGGLTNYDLSKWTSATTRSVFSRHEVAMSSAERAGIGQVLRFKATLVDEFLKNIRQTLDEAGGGKVTMAPSAFPPPWSYISGMDFARAAKHCDEISVKLYGMHWAMMLRFYGDQLRDANPGISTTLLTRALVRLLDIADDDGLPDLKDYRYPAPHEHHPVGQQAQIRKIQAAQSQAGETPIHVLAHGYGPADDFRKRIEVACAASPHGFWVNRYGYLSDEKLDIIGQVCGKE